MKFAPSLVALALFGACALPDPLGEGSGEAPHGEDGGENGGDEMDMPDPEALPDLGNDSDGGDPVGYERVTAWLLEPGGDLLVEATVGSSVREHFPSAAQYEMRLADEKLLVSLVDTEGRALFVFREDVFHSQSFIGASFAVSVAFGSAPELFDLLCPLVTCFVPPCFCEFPWPTGDVGPAVFEVARYPIGVQGKLRTHGIEANVTFTPEGERILEPVTLPPEVLSELDRFMAVHGDTFEVFDEIDRMGDDGTIPWAMECALREMAPDYVTAAMGAGIQCLGQLCPPPPSDFPTCSR